MDSKSSPVHKIAEIPAEQSTLTRLRKRFPVVSRWRLQPTLDAVAKIGDAATKAEDERKAKEAADKFEGEIVARERGRYEVLRDAAHFIPADQLAAVSGSSVKDVLVKALESVLPNAAQYDEAFLRGSLAMAVAQKGTNAVPGTPGAPGGGNGIGPAPVITGSSDAVTQARDEYMVGQAKQWQNARYTEQANPNDAA